MKTVFCSLLLTALAILPARADLTIVYSTTVQPPSHDQKAEGTPNDVAAANNMTIKFKRDKPRTDAPLQPTISFVGGTGRWTNLLNDQKIIAGIPPDKMRAIAEKS